LISGCCAASKDVTKYKSAEKLATEKFGSGHKLIKNKSESFILCLKSEEKQNQPHTSVEYFVYDLDKEEIIFSETLLDAEVGWFDDHNLEIKINPETISDDNGVKMYLLNVITKVKRKSNS
jgi:hypothetical protein